MIKCSAMISLISVSLIFLLFISTIKCETLQLDASGDRILLAKIISGMANCLAIDPSANLTDCFEKYQSNQAIQSQITIEIPKSENDSLQLICRDSDSLTMQVIEGSENKFAARGTIYTIEYHETDKNDSPNFMEISDVPFIQIANLTKDTQYSVTATIFSNNFEYRRIGNILQAKTLPMDNYTPTPIPEPIDIEYGFKNGSNLPFAIIRWQSDDLVCSYSFGIFILSTHKAGDPNNQFNRARLLTEPQTLGSIEITNLDFLAEYRLLIRGVNRKYQRIEGEPLEKEFRVPSCYRFHGIDYNKCVPLQPKNITTSNESDGNEYHYNIDINWAKSDYFPDRYNVTLLTKSNGARHRFVSGTQNHVRFEDVKIIDSTYDVLIRAISKAGHSTVFIQNISLLKANQKFWQRSHIIIVPILIAIVVLLVILLVKCRPKAHCIYPMKFRDEEFRELAKSNMEIKATDIRMGKTLGEGHFGIVRKGYIKSTGQIVAVKMIKDTDTISRIEQFEIYRKFLEEIKLMKEVKHENIIKIIGHCTVDVSHLMLLTEFCSKGNLLNYLRYFRDNGTIHLNTVADTFQGQKVFDDERLQQCKTICSGTESSQVERSLDNFFCNRMYDEMNATTVMDGDPHYSNAAAGGALFVANPSYGLMETDGYESPRTDCAEQKNEVETRSLSSLDLLAIARQIATGMVHLSDRQIIHRDLAARNILVGSDKTIRIADFGLSRDIYADNIYVKSTAGRLPIKWLALESMLRREFTVKSDIWSYAILLYEIMTLGCSPYPGISTDSLLDYLKRDKRLQKPDICSVKFYEMMLSCWQLQPNTRPSFEELEQMIIKFEMSCGNYKAFTVDVRDEQQ